MARDFQTTVILFVLFVKIPEILGTRFCVPMEKYLTLNFLPSRVSYCIFVRKLFEAKHCEMNLFREIFHPFTAGIFCKHFISQRFASKFSHNFCFETFRIKIVITVFRYFLSFLVKTHRSRAGQNRS